MLIEPTETESVETLDAFADTLIAIAARGATATRTLVTSAPHTAPVRRLDEATAARQPNLRWRAMTGRRDALPGLTRRDPDQRVTLTASTGRSRRCPRQTPSHARLETR